MAEKERISKRLEELEEELKKTKDNKATNKHLAKLRSKVALAKKELVEAGKHQKGKGFFVKKMGDATVSLLGFPSAGKSSLLNALTNSRSKTAAYAFTTTEIIPGTMLYNDAHIQILDMPGIIEDAHLGKGGGRSVIAQMKISELVVFVIDIKETWQLARLLDELEKLNIHINKIPPRISIIEKDNANGISIEVNKSAMGSENIRAVLNAFGIYKASVSIWDRIDENDLISFLSKNSYYVKAIVALNKIDLEKESPKIASQISSKQSIEVFPVSASTGAGLEELKAGIYRNLGIIRIYTKPRFSRAEPMIVKTGTTIGAIAKMVHAEVLNTLKCAYVTGSSVKFQNQRVGVNHVVEEGDVITFIREK
ncbi:50S ribosome-binding GTPase [Candidatus Marsarchaeota archaeon]|nr:50S ribosome-binding GTPase [Candidatus Marsarchaeota archaeon]MCL5404772.1 50S ribosome-binding GTPase [Candidatus Marsarchaeota archaeon]